MDAPEKLPTVAEAQAAYDLAHAAFKVAERAMLDAWYALQAALRREGK